MQRFEAGFWLSNDEANELEHMLIDLRDEFRARDNPNRMQPHILAKRRTLSQCLRSFHDC